MKLGLRSKMIQSGERDDGEVTLQCND